MRLNISLIPMQMLHPFIIHPPLGLQLLNALNPLHFPHPNPKIIEPRRAIPQNPFLIIIFVDSQSSGHKLFDYALLEELEVGFGLVGIWQGVEAELGDYFLGERGFCGV